MRPPLFERDFSSVTERRSWTPAERRIVLRGLIGRLSVAIEPLICAAAFLAITIVPFMHQRPEVQVVGAPPQFTLAQVIAPIFGLATLAFALYALLVVVKPLRAYAATFKPLFIIDGYVRYRTDAETNAYIAVLDHERTALHEWMLAHKPDIVCGTFPALVEFSDFGGVHRIDGRETGVLPQSFMPFGIGNYSYGSRLHRKDLR